MHTARLALAVLAGWIVVSMSAIAAEPAAKPMGPLAGMLKPCASVAVDPPTYVVLGKSTVVKLSAPATPAVPRYDVTARRGPVTTRRMP